MAVFLVLLVGIPLAALIITYSAGRWLGSRAACSCWLLSLLPLGWASYCMLRYWHDTPGDGMAMGIGGLAVTFAIILSAASAVGWWLARRRSPQPAEPGTGLSPQATRASSR